MQYPNQRGHMLAGSVTKQKHYWTMPVVVGVISTNGGQLGYVSNTLQYSIASIVRHV